ncbi:MFS transporter [Bartonella sp. DGB2]|uniref:MFS transporter n=1 Tax=Bartonella sp. DGB2 TaxID=3388426 RepID=UPI0039900382
MPSNTIAAHQPKSSISTILLASLIGTTIEFFDFYVFATAAALVFPKLFFPSENTNLALLQSFLIFGAAFFARPFGSIIFGHFGDKAGRKSTLIAALLTMGISTVIIGFLPTYENAGWWAPFFLTLCRLGQGLGLGGEWGGAVLLAVENAPPEKRDWYAIFPQLGAPIGLILSAGTYWLMWNSLTPDELHNWGWRIPFIASAVLILVGLWVRFSIAETPAFQKAMACNERVKVPAIDIFIKHPRALFLGTFAGMTVFVLFYLFTAYLLSYSTHHLHLEFDKALEIEIIGSFFLGLFIIFGGKLCEKIGRRLFMIWATVLTGLFSFSVPFLLTAGYGGIMALSICGLSIMGLTYAPIGATLTSPFPTAVRYTGASITFNLAGIAGASIAPYIAEYLVQNFGPAYIGYYLLLSSFISLLCFVGFTNDEISN